MWATSLCSGKTKREMFELKIIAENDKCIFYTNSMCEFINEDAKKKDVNLTCIIAEQKDTKFIEYLLIDDKNEPIRSSTLSDDVACYVDMVYLSTKKG